MKKILLIKISILFSILSHGQKLSESSLSLVLKTLEGKNKSISCDDLKIEKSKITFENKAYSIIKTRESESSLFIDCEALSVRLLFLNPSICLVAIIDLKGIKKIRRYMNQDKTTH